MWQKSSSIAILIVFSWSKTGTKACPGWREGSLHWIHLDWVCMVQVQVLSSQVVCLQFAAELEPGTLLLICNIISHNKRICPIGNLYSFGQQPGVFRRGLGHFWILQVSQENNKGLRGSQMPGLRRLLCQICTGECATAFLHIICCAPVSV